MNRIQFEYGGRRYDISFRRDAEENMYRCEIRLVDENGRVVLPTDILEDRGLMWSGVAFRHPSDRPNNETGRKLALSRALKFCPLEMRRLAWKAYFTRNENTALRKHKYNMKSFV